MLPRGVGGGDGMLMKEFKIYATNNLTTIVALTPTMFGTHRVIEHSKKDSKKNRIRNFRRTLPKVVVDVIIEHFENDWEIDNLWLADEWTRYSESKKTGKQYTIHIPAKWIMMLVDQKLPDITKKKLGKTRPIT